MRERRIVCVWIHSLFLVHIAHSVNVWSLLSINNYFFLFQCRASSSTTSTTRHLVLRCLGRIPSTLRSTSSVWSHRRTDPIVSQTSALTFINWLLFQTMFLLSYCSTWLMYRLCIWLMMSGFYSLVFLRRIQSSIAFQYFNFSGVSHLAAVQAVAHSFISNNQQDHRVSLYFSSRLVQS